LNYLKTAAVGLSLLLAGCGPQTFGTFQAVKEIATATVPPEVVMPAANTFDILKGAAVNYGRYCIKEKMAPAMCNVASRRAVIKAVRVGTGARDRMVANYENDTPVASSVYNLVVGAISDLKNSPAAASQFTGVPLQ